MKAKYRNKGLLTLIPDLKEHAKPRTIAVRDARGVR
jgi:hypothetical protein